MSGPDDPGEGRFQRWARCKTETRLRTRTARKSRHGGAAPVSTAVDTAPDLAPIPEVAPENSIPSVLSSNIDSPGEPATKSNDENEISENEISEEAQAALDLPDIDELDGESDYTQFLANGVPEALTRAALQKLWRSDPVFANLDGLNDYDEDFRLIDTVIQAVKTNYKVGKGMVVEPRDSPDQVAEDPIVKPEAKPSPNQSEHELDENGDAEDTEKLNANSESENAESSFGDVKGSNDLA